MPLGAVWQPFPPPQVTHEPNRAPDGLQSRAAAPVLCYAQHLN